MIYTIVGAASGAFLAYAGFLIYARTGTTLSRPHDVEILRSMWICSGMITGAIVGFSANFPLQANPK